MNLGKNYHVNPIIFLGIHVAATPLFIAAVAWLVRNYRKKRSIVLPVIVAVLIFNAANIYLVAVGKNFPLFVYIILASTTLWSAYFSYRKIRKKAKTS